MPGISVTIAASKPASAFSRLDLPAFGRPAITTCKPVAQRPPLARGLPDRREPRADLREAVAHLGRREELRVLVREVDRRLDVGAKLHHRAASALHLARELAEERTQRRARRLRRARGDEVGDRLGLREVELVVVEGALGELARARQPRAELDRARDEQVLTTGPPWPCSSEHVLARETSSARGSRARGPRRSSRRRRLRTRRRPRAAAAAARRGSRSRSRASRDPRRGRCRCRHGRAASPARRWCP